MENADFHLGELQPGAPWMQRAAQSSEMLRRKRKAEGLFLFTLAIAITVSIAFNFADLL